jgi:hypothetical protein
LCGGYYIPLSNSNRVGSTDFEVEVVGFEILSFIEDSALEGGKFIIY